MAIAAIEDVLFVFGASLDSEPDLSGDMLGVNERAEGNGGGFKSANVVKGGEWGGEVGGGGGRGGGQGMEAC